MEEIKKQLIKDLYVLQDIQPFSESDYLEELRWCIQSSELRDFAKGFLYRELDNISLYYSEDQYVEALELHINCLPEDILNF